MESEQLRNALMALAMQKKCDKIVQTLTQQINTTLENWEKNLYAYFNLLTQLSTLTQVCEQQNTIVNIRRALRACKEIIKDGSEQFGQVNELIEKLIPISTINRDWMNSIIKHNDHLAIMKEKIQPILMTNSDRDIVDTVRKLIEQINDVQGKIQVLSTKMQETVDQRIQVASNLVSLKENIEKADDDNSEVSDGETN